ncbi:MAG: hypothetical protein HY882_00320 [Deltaproteobacteria bacterium]|nr:hypothetical protein [Deltaproteobacteria bacterium]
MTCHRQLGQPVKAIEVYRRCKKILSTVLGIEPSLRIEAIYKDLIANIKVCVTN